MKKFSVWDAEGKQSFIDADSVTVKKKKDGLHLKFKIGTANLHRNQCIAMTEVMPPMITLERKAE